MPRNGTRGTGTSIPVAAADAVLSVAVIGHRPSHSAFVERGDERPDVLGDEFHVATSVVPDVDNQRVWRVVDGVHVGHARRVDAPAQGLEEESEVVVEEAVADKQCRPVREVGLQLQRNRVVRILAAHPEDELDVILIRDDDRFRFVDVSVDLEDHGALRGWAAVVARPFQVWGVDAHTWLLVRASEGLLEELVVVGRYYPNEVELGECAEYRRGALADVHGGPYRVDEIATRACDLVEERDSLEIARVFVGEFLREARGERERLAQCRAERRPLVFVVAV